MGRLLRTVAVVGAAKATASSNARGPCRCSHAVSDSGVTSRQPANPNALMLMLDKLKLPDLVGHEPFLVSRPEASTRKMQSPNTANTPTPHRYRGLYLHEVS